MLLKILHLAKELLDYNGILVISGILDSEEEIFRQVLAKQDFFVDRMEKSDEWLVFCARI
jgi:ribosomal protein L11 methylase PrmA